MSGFVLANRSTFKARYYWDANLPTIIYEQRAFKMILSEQEILETLMHWRTRIAAAAWLVIKDAHSAEDIFQNVVLKALTKAVQFDSKGAMLSWALITARREGIDWLRKHRNESTCLDSEILELLEQEWLSETAHPGGARVDALRDCLESIPEKSRRLLRLRYFEGYKCEDLAEMLGLGLQAIYKRLSRLHGGLKECIELRLNQSQSTES
jgi:RNA polymerase sigma-70 factor (ECF subfamily)